MDDKPIFFSDLDLTLLYSHRAIRKYHNNTYNALVVEEHEHKPLSFIKLECWDKLVKLSCEILHFVPTTTRTFEQYSRIHIPRVNINHAIVLNGAKIYHNNHEDEVWRNHIHDKLYTFDTNPTQIYNKSYSDIMNIPGVNKYRNAEDYFLYIVKDEADNKQLDQYLNIHIDSNNYMISNQGRKSYIVPKCIDKGEAINYVKNKVGCTTTYAAGDSKLDMSMSNYVDYFIQPAHGEAVGLLQNAIITDNTGILAAEDIINYIMNNN